MIWFVDEDEIQLKPLRLGLTLHGLSSEQIVNADEALAALDHIAPDDFIFIDVMLAAAADESQSQFKREETADYKLTGLLLADKILERRKDIRAERLVLMSQAASTAVISAVDAFCRRRGLKWVKKSAYDDPNTFADEIEQMLKGK